MTATLRAYIDLTRLQFFFAWPLLFCSGYLLATTVYGNFAWFDLVRVALIGFFGFEAGLVLNDYIDRDYDKKDIESDKLTKYWRTFGTRPIPAGIISPNHALALFIGLAAITSGLIATLPYPHSLLVILIMAYSYSIEIFYQMEKRQPQKFPFAQIIGRTDFALFPVAGYLCLGHPDLNAFLYFVFFYPFAMAHLGANDLIDVANDRERGMSTIPMVYDIPRTACWIAGFTIIHAMMAFLFMTRLGLPARIGIITGLCLIIIANIVILKNKTPAAALKVLPFFHVAMILYAGGIVADAFF
ncbi:MAG: UbiA family prenyltransferase [Methanoregula sp.]|jgi:4-hydroxybenzoate polyprenyltransferase|nr:UbiA family prenyltransferase [Methanoregula sp.]